MRNGARLVAGDPIPGFTELAPSVTATYSGPATLRPGNAFSIGYSAGDDTGLAKVSLDLTGAMTVHVDQTLGGVRTSSGSF